MNFKKTGLAVAFGLVASMGANALDVTYTPSAAATKHAVSATAAQLKAVASGTVVINLPVAGAGVSTIQVGDTVTVTAAGAKFDRAALNAVPVAWAGTEVATWVLDSTDTILTGTVTGAGATNTVSAGTLTGVYDLTGVAAGTDVTISATVSRLVLGTSSVVHKQQAAVANAIDLATTASLQKYALLPTANPAQKDTATVASSFVNLDGTSGTTTTLVVDAASLAVTTLDVEAADAAAATGTLFYKLSGVPSAVTKITYPLTGSILSQSDSTGLAAPTTATASSDFFLDGAGNAYAKVTAAGSRAVVPSVLMTMTVDGTAAISPTDLKLTVDYIAGSGDIFTNHTSQSELTIARVVRNGSAFSVNSSGPLNTVKITDVSGGLTSSTSKISVTAYDAAGTEVSGTVTIPSLTSNSTVTIAVSDLTTAYADAIRFDFVVESTEIVASNVKKATTGTTVTTYRNAANSAGTVAGNGAL